MPKSGVTLDEQVARIEDQTTPVQVQRAREILDSEDEIVIRLAFKYVGQRKATHKGLTRSERQTYNVLVSEVGQVKADVWKNKRLAEKNEKNEE